MNKKINLKQAKIHGGRRKILPKRKPYSTPAPSKNKVLQKRYLFLQYLRAHYSLKNVKASLWQGTALHLLEMTDLISPEMHQAAHTYFSLSNYMRKEGPRWATSRIKQMRPKNFIPLRDQAYDEPQEQKIEKQWHDLSALLEENKIKSLVDELGDTKDLITLEYLLKTESALAQLQKGLILLHTYLQKYRP